MKNQLQKKAFMAILAIPLICLFNNLHAQVVHPVASKKDAKFSVAIVPHESFADLKVYRTDSLNNQVNKNIGYWVISETQDHQTIPIVWVSDPITADLKIVLVNYPERAGWVNKHKKSLLKL